MCGGAALLLGDGEGGQCASELYETLNVLQHRGQDAAGIITCQKGRLFQVKGNGMVRDVFNDNNIRLLQGAMGVAHVRYPTAGTSSASEAQPFYVNSPYGLVLAHNGNLNNSGDLRTYLGDVAHRHINTDSDSEMLLNVFADFLTQNPKRRIDHEDVFRALSGVMERCFGGYACFAMVAGYGIIGFRDPHGIRPICYGTRVSAAGKGVDHMLCSESIGITALGFSIIDDLKPGEGIVITMSGNVYRQQCAKNASLSPCLFEYVYFARPDSILDGISVYQARVNMGTAIAETIRKRFSDLRIDTVIPVPDTSRTAALQCAHILGIPYREGLTKNRYVGRTFIMPGMRKQAVRRKLNAMPSEFKGKNVLLVDDSIVRGTTSKEIVAMAREAGAEKVYFASCSPPIRFPNVYGIDMPSFAELVAHGRTEEEIAEFMGVDAVVYLDLPSLLDACAQLNPSIKSFETSVFSGEYVTGTVTKEYLDSLQSDRAAVKARQASDVELIGLHNHSILNSH